MYAAAGIGLDDVEHISVIRWFGLVEAWPALAAWILTFFAMVISKAPREWVARGR